MDSATASAIGPSTNLLEMPSRNQARFIGLLYLIFAALGIWSFAYAHPNTIVAGNAAATAQKIVEHEFLFRLDKAFGLVTSVLFIVIALLLYNFFKQVDRYQALLMVALVLVGVSIGFVSESVELTALKLFKEDTLQPFTKEQAQYLAMTMLKISSNIGQMLTLFWGLWLFPLGWLVYKSRFFPRLLGILLVINGVGYVIHAFTFVLFPGQLSTVLKFIFPMYFLGELPFALWLLIKGIK